MNIDGLVGALLPAFFVLALGFIATEDEFDRVVDPVKDGSAVHGEGLANGNTR
jgi:hypothetical protein